MYSFHSAWCGPFGYPRMLPLVESVRSPVATMKLGSMTLLPVVTTHLSLSESAVPLAPMCASDTWMNQSTRLASAE